MSKNLTKTIVFPGIVVLIWLCIYGALGAGFYVFMTVMGILGTLLGATAGAGVVLARGASPLAATLAGLVTGLLGGTAAGIGAIFFVANAGGAMLGGATPSPSIYMAMTVSAIIVAIAAGLSAMTVNGAIDKLYARRIP